MTRPKLPNGIKKERINLTISKEVKEMADVVRIRKSISISELVEEYIRKEYKILQDEEETSINDNY